MLSAADSKVLQGYNKACLSVLYRTWKIDTKSVLDKGKYFYFDAICYICVSCLEIILLKNTNWNKSQEALTQSYLQNHRISEIKSLRYLPLNKKLPKYNLWNVSIGIYLLYLLLFFGIYEEQHEHDVIFNMFMYVPSIWHCGPVYHKIQSIKNLLD